MYTDIYLIQLKRVERTGVWHGNEMRCVLTGHAEAAANGLRISY